VPMTMSTTLFTTTKNEIDGFKAILPRIRRAWGDEVFILDADSTDGPREDVPSIGSDDRRLEGEVTRPGSGCLPPLGE